MAKVFNLAPSFDGKHVFRVSRRFFTEWSRFKYGKRFHPRPRDKRTKLEADSTMTHKSCNLKYPNTTNER